MLNSRRLWLVVVGFLVVVTGSLFAYRFWWYPQTLRGRFDRVRIGMTEKQVKKTLGEPGDFRSEKSPPTFIYSGEIWELDDGRIRHWQWSPAVSAYDLRPYWGHSEWGYDEFDVVVFYDKQRRVCEKAWYDYRPPSPFWQRVRQWLPLW